MEVGSTPGTGSATLVDHRRGFLDGPLIQLYFGGGPHEPLMRLEITVTLGLAPIRYPPCCQMTFRSHTYELWTR